MLGTTHPLADNVSVAKAFKFAIKHHAEQKRKYTGEPYVVHLLAVSVTVYEHTRDPIATVAAILHDVVEDTPVTFEDVQREFGDEVAALVKEVSNVSKPEDGNRIARKKIDQDHFGSATARGQTIKLADLIDNSGSLIKHDPLGFGPTWMGEKRDLLKVLLKGDSALLEKANKIVKDYYERYPQAEEIYRKRHGGRTVAR